MSWTTFDPFRQVLIDCINKMKFKNNDMNRCECTGGGFKGMGMGWLGGGGGHLFFSGKHF